MLPVKTVQGAIAPLQKVVNNLNSVASKRQESVQKSQNQISELNKTILEDSIEAARAERILKKLSELLGEDIGQESTTDTQTDQG